MAKSCKWEQFEKTWQAALDEAGVKQGFHMNEFAHSQGELKQWKEPQRRKLFGKLLIRPEDTVRRHMRFWGH